MEILEPGEIKLLAIDIDGTLLDPEGKISPRNLAAVKAAQEASIIVTLATARRYRGTTQVADELELAGPLILYDGALIVEYPQGKVLHTLPLEARVGQQAADLLLRHHIQPVVHPDLGVQEEIWTGEDRELDNLWLTAYFTINADQLRRMPYATLCAGHADPLRVVAFDEERTIRSVVPEVERLNCTWTAIKRGNYGCAELAIMNPACSKASGVRAVAQRLGIPLEQVMAVGDNNNDIAMLQTVGWGVAMGHASERVKAAARAITASNAEDGVALAIERYALGRAESAAANSRNRSICL